MRRTLNYINRTK